MPGTDTEYLITHASQYDLVNLTTHQIVENVTYARKVHEALPYLGKKLDDSLWREWVLPHRILDENVDLWRKDFYERMQPVVNGQTSVKDVVDAIHTWLMVPDGTGAARVGLRDAENRPKTATQVLKFGGGTCGELSMLEKDVGTQEFESVSYDLAMRLALTLGRIDKDHLTSKTFVGHLRQVERAKERFYKKKLTVDETEAYLLPYRIRYEPTTKPEWLVTLAGHFRPITADTTSADDAAKVVLGWMAANLKLLDPALSYKLPSRGDLDPITVFKGSHGDEIDVAIFGVASLRASGVAARLVWAPALRGEIGGKAWLEYLGQAGKWIPWVPSFGSCADHAAEIRKTIGAKIVLVMARPEAPVEITGSYVETVEVTFDVSVQDVDISLMVQGREELMPARGSEVESMRNERKVRIGRGPAVIAAAFSNRSFALLPVDCPPGTEQISILANGGNLAIGGQAGKAPE
jgi:hypothetical protein